MERIKIDDLYYRLCVFIESLEKAFDKGEKDIQPFQYQIFDALLRETKKYLPEDPIITEIEPSPQPEGTTISGLLSCLGQLKAAMDNHPDIKVDYSDMADAMFPTRDLW